MKTVIHNVKVILPHEICNGYVVVEGATIAGIGTGDPPPVEQAELLDGRGLYLSPGFVELHAHGAGGRDCMDGAPEDFAVLCQTLLRHGATCLLPTTVAASREDLEHCVDVFLQVQKTLGNGPHLPGLHLEGPYLNMAQKGAIDPRYIHNPDPLEYEALVERAQGGIARWTLAPELDGALAMGDFLARHGIVASIGHSEADYQQVLAACRHGFTHVTHLYSAMSTVVRRNGFRYAGVLESAFLLDCLSVEIIADGCHLPVELLQYVYKLKGPKATCLVCDSMRSAGTTDTQSVLGCLKDGLKVIVEDGVAKLPDRSGFAGSIATDDRLVRVMHQEAGVGLVDCIEMMCLTPARVMGLDRRKGSIAPGKDADLILFDKDIQVQWVMVEGKEAYAKL